MKINFLQSGGMLYSSIANPYSIDAKKDRENIKTEGTSSSSDDSGILPKAVLNKLYEEGIPVDFEKFMIELDSFSRLDFSLGINKRSLYQILAMANNVIKQSQYLKKAEEEAVKNGALDEFAVDLRGYLYVMDSKQQIHKVHSSDYDARKMYESGKYALTVGELIKERLFNPLLVNDFQIANTIANNIGQEKINDYILDIIAKVGNSESVTEAFIDVGSLVGKDKAKRPSNAALLQLLALYGDIQALGPEAIVKLTNTDKGSNLNAAFNYILSVLPNNMKTQLKARNVAEGGKYSDGPDFIRDIISKSLYAANNSTTKREIDPVSGTVRKPGSGSAGSSKTFYLTPNELLFNGDLNQTHITLTDGTNNNLTSFTVAGSSLAALTTDNGDAVSRLPLGIALNATISKYLSPEQIYVGDQKMSQGYLDHMAYIQDEVAAVWMPSNQDGSINWNGIHGFSKAEKEIREEGITSIEDKNKIHQKYQSYGHYNEEGKIVPNDPRQVTLYIMTYAYVNDDDELDTDNPLIEELKGDLKNRAKNLMDSVFTKEIKKKYGISNRNSFWDDIYKAPVFIRVNEFASQNAYVYGGHGSSMTPQSLETNMIHLQIQQARPQRPIVGSADLLYN